MNVRIDFFADLVCPWCYVGWEALKRAAEARPSVACSVKWRNYLLNPEAPTEGVDRKEYFNGRYEPEKLAAIHATLMQAADAAGVPLNLSAPTRLPNSLDAHRLIHWAAGQQLAELVIDELFAAYWVEGRDIGELDVLAEIADDAGLDAALVRELLATPADRSSVLTLHVAAVRSGITGVPVAILNGKAVLMGAESPENYGEAIDRVAA